MRPQPRTEIASAPVLDSLGAEVRRLLPTALAAVRCAAPGCKRVAPEHRAYCEPHRAAVMAASRFAPEKAS